MREKLLAELEQFKISLTKITKINEVLELKSNLLSKESELSKVMKSMKDFSIEEKKIMGPLVNEIKREVEDTCLQLIKKIEREEALDKYNALKIDETLRPSLWKQNFLTGGQHPTYKVQQELEDIFLSMGFDVLDGPHIEDEYHNFEALNIPKTHPARDMQDTFWFKDKKHLLRTHTSTIQIRGMKERKPPFRFIAPGKVFRCERTDATHEMVFHQLEGMMVGENISVSHLIYFMKTLLERIFKRSLEVRLRPGYFPFVEPGFELDIRWKKPDPKDPSQKYGGWLELLPCGMVHPHVLEAGGIDPKKFSGFAFGLGLDRLVMVRYGIEDVRHFHKGDLRFLEQFKQY
jgi:phenylalanyl-tRNA synthetase alpha chain